jgi:hypothetical protein
MDCYRIRIVKKVSARQKGAVLLWCSGYYFGLNIFLFTGLIFFWLAYRVTKKIKRKAEQEVFESF